jgi:hypothetical protein
MHFGGKVTTERYPTAVSIVIYNRESSGAFVTWDSSDRAPALDRGGYCPNVAAFESEFGECRDRFEVLDPEAFTRWSTFEPNQIKT